jgi:hypothetical protein
MVTVLDGWFKFNVSYYVNKMLTPLSEELRVCGSGNFRNLRVHADFAHPHKNAPWQKFMISSEFVMRMACPRRVLQDWVTKFLGDR